MAAPDLRVGLVYCPALAPLLSPDLGLVDLVEVEPQFFWRELRGKGGKLSSSEELERLFDSPIPKLIHSVGCPVGGSSDPDHRQISLLRHAVDNLEPLWVSEHLSFSRVCIDGHYVHPLFLLPPLQTVQGIAQAEKSIRALNETLGAPVAIETGVNYLAPIPGELEDGDFMAGVAEKADCGILLDLHNLLTNERNGRQSARDVLARLPLERVWEIHLAGGFAEAGYWIDAHSGPAEPALLELLKCVLPVAPNLRAVIFEILPSLVPRVGLDQIANHLNQLKGICYQRGPGETCPVVVRRQSACGPASSIAATGPLSDVRTVEWEKSLVELVLGRASTGALKEVAADPGIEIYKNLVKSFRRGMVSDALTMTIRLLMLHHDVGFVNDLFEEYWALHSPEPFTSTEARGFAQFLTEKNLSVPYLTDVLSIECAMLIARVEKQVSTASVSVEPRQLLAALGAGHLPEEIETGRYILEITADEKNEANYFCSH
jgi:uncharacterized protein